MKTKRHANKEPNVSPHVRRSKVNTLVFVYQKRHLSDRQKSILKKKNGKEIKVSFENEDENCC
jgi:hypothetical protein